MGRVFSAEALQKLEDNYRTVVKPVHGESSRGGCMKAVYIGLGSLFGPRYGFRGDFHKSFFREARRREDEAGVPEGRFNTIDRVFRALEHEAVALPEQRYKPTAGRWERADGVTVDSLEADLIDQISTLPEGPHFFGVAADGAVHSLLLMLEKSETGVRVFWMDQFSAGFDTVRSGGFVSSPDVTGRLDVEIREIGTNTTSVWRLSPDMAANVAIDLDIDADGVPDFQVPATVEVEDPDHSF